jgi:hypothetical protein
MWKESTRSGSDRSAWKRLENIRSRSEVAVPPRGASVKKFRVDENLGNLSSGRVERGVIMRLDELFPP